MNAKIKSAFDFFLNSYHRPENKYLLAFSGGGDSMVLCDLLDREGLDFSIAHCNFHLRAEESDGDAEFAKKTAENYKRPFYLKDFEIDHTSGKSVQESARELRYRWFDELMRKHHFNYILTAHHADDQVETFFMHLFRGSGLKGLAGIPAQRNSIVRPLLDCFKEDIQQYLQEHNLEYRSDSSNQNSKYKRNYLRNEVLPLLDKNFGGWRKRLLANMSQVEESEFLLCELIARNNEELLDVDEDELRVRMQKLIAFENAETLLYYLLRNHDYSHDVCREIVVTFETGSTISGKVFLSPTCTGVCTTGEFIVRKNPPEKDRNIYFIEEGSRHVLIPGCHIEIQISDEVPQNLKSLGPDTAVFDKALLKFPLQIRSWRKGDRFIPFGMKGFKKLSDFFTDQKLDLFEKEQAWLLISGEEIAWVLGYRSDDRFKVSASSNKVIIINYRHLNT